MNPNTTEAPAAAERLSNSWASAESGAAQAVEVRVARTIADVEAIREIWCSWNTDRDSDIDFCLKFVWSGHEFIRPHVIVISRGGRPDAMFVGRIERMRLVSRIGYLRLPGLSVRALIFASGGFLGKTSPDNCETFVKCVVDSLKRDDADVALLQQINLESPMLQAALRLPGIVSRDYMLQPMPHSLLSLSESAEQVWQGLSSGLRTELRRKKRKLLRKYGSGARVQCFREARELEDAIPQVEGIAKKTYQRALDVGFRDTEQMRQRVLFFAGRGWLRMYLLTLDGEPAAFWVGTVYQGSFSSDYLAFDPQFSDYSPGTYLAVEVVEDLCRSGVAKLNFGAGAGRYKERFSNRSFNLHQIGK